MDLQITSRVVVVAVLVFFWVGRLAYSALMGKRVRTNVSSEIVSGRFWFSASVYFIFPVLILLNIYPLSQVAVISSLSVFQFVLGAAVSFLGLILMILARLHRETDWGFMGDSAGDKLFTKGVYSITRHPYYVGAIAVALGVYVLLNSWLILSVVPLICFVKKVISKEDFFLKNKFGDVWEKYFREVGIVPWM